MSDFQRRMVPASGLVIGAVLGMAGTFAPSASLRGLAWGLDGMALIVATAALTIHHLRRGNESIATGFLVFVIGLKNVEQRLVNKKLTRAFRQRPR